jgi:hypothetical protein
MGWEQIIEYIDVEVTLPPPVSKQIWDGDKFVPMKLYRLQYEPGIQQRNWLWNTYGPAGTYVNGHYWDYSRSGNFTVMDEKVYTWYQMKWGNK